MLNSENLTRKSLIALSNYRQRMKKIKLIYEAHLRKSNLSNGLIGLREFAKSRKTPNFDKNEIFIYYANKWISRTFKKDFCSTISNNSSLINSNKDLFMNSSKSFNE